MKTLILVRHASAEDYTGAGTDLHRSLTDEGEREAQAMARKIKSKDLKIDMLASSPAVRTQQTAKQFQSVLGLKNEIDIQPNIYEASPKEYEKVIAQFPDSWNTVIIFGHNPGITQFSNSLTDETIHYMPNAAAFMASAEVKTWEDFLFSEKKFDFFETL